MSVSETLSAVVSMRTVSISTEATDVTATLVSTAMEATVVS